jgi:NitT/TauT family transport system substrate-binding protein
LASSVKFLKDHRDLAKKIVTANQELTDWIQAHPDEAQKALITELKEETRTDFAPEAVAQAWKRIKFTTAVLPELVTRAVQDGKDAGFLKGSTDTSKLVESP